MSKSDPIPKKGISWALWVLRFDCEGFVFEERVGYLFKGREIWFLA
jgi:hypothetical protein